MELENRCLPIDGTALAFGRVAITGDGTGNGKIRESARRGARILLLATMIHRSNRMGSGGRGEARGRGGARARRTTRGTINEETESRST